jgi:arsenite methyltransferase
MDDYKNGLLAAGFEHVEIVDSGADLNAYAEVENQAGCCSPAMDMRSPLQIVEAPCCIPTPVETSLHDDLTTLLSQHDVNVYAIKPHTTESKTCCGPTCCV